MKGTEILNDTQKEKVKNYLISELNKINSQLESLRDCSSLKEGFGTMRLAKKQRKVEELCKKKFAITQTLFDDFDIEKS